MSHKLHQSKMLDNTKISSIFYNLGQKSKNGKTTISQLLDEFHENGLLLAMIFFSLPIAIPLPYPPGFTTILGTPLIILSIQMLLGLRKIALPKRIDNYQINNLILMKISKKVVPLIKFIEQYAKPRFNFASSIYCEQFIGFISLICAITVALPLPLTNAVPAFGITLMALGLLNRDGLLIILGFVISMIGLTIAYSAIIAGWIGMKYLLNLIF